MTFDDGILTICKVENLAEPGDKPHIGLKKQEEFYYGYDSIGIQRYYTAKQAQQQIDEVVNIPDWNNIGAVDICVLENQEQYKIQMIQKLLDEDGLKYTKLSLERKDEKYEVETGEDQECTVESDG